MVWLGEGLGLAEGRAWLWLWKGVHMARGGGLEVLCLVAGG